MDTKSETGPIGLQEVELDALVVLVRVMAGLDQDITPEESDQMGLIAMEVGEDSFWRHMQASSSKKLDLDGALALAGAVERPEGREAIFALLEGLASADGFEPDETRLLDKLRELWIG